MNDWMPSLAPLLGGILLGVFYFGGLWWTVRRLSQTEWPMRLYLTSLGVRTAILLLAFFFILNVGVLELVTAFAGFIVTRFAIVRSLGLTSEPDLRPAPRSTTSGSTEAGAS